MISSILLKITWLCILCSVSIVTGDERALEFPDGETPPDVFKLTEASSEQENEEKSKSPVRFIKSSDGTIKISSVVNHTPKWVQKLPPVWILFY